ncbi:uncharacterized protein LOC143579133 [Bidens hawaiensis]|uniref:uncharacterized protein LOC143579133 n=1 Tax=Bidens hawaiensis TaxID=980011 RepID=UPI004049C6E6
METGEAVTDVLSERGLVELGNGNFLGLVEMLEEFDPVIKEHGQRIINDEVHVHYLGHNIQNELIFMIAQEIKKEIIKQIKEAKYYSIILDCTPDSSHQEQLTIIVRYLKFYSNSVTVEESFLGFLDVNDTTGKGLFDITVEELKSLGLELDDMRSQGYDNGANMKGKHQGVQTRFLNENPRAFYTPCGCHSLNLILYDMATISTKGKNNVKSWSLNSLSQTRWESRVESFKAIKLQLDDVREALLEVGEKDGDLAIADEATTITENIGFDFLVSIIIWYEVLDKVNIVRKRLQSKDTHIEIAIKEIKRLIDFFKEFRENGFSKAIDEAEKIAFEMGIDPIFAQKRVIKRIKQSDECSSSQEASFTPQENFRVNYFLYIIDQAITSLKTRFDQFKNNEKLFGFLFPQNLRGIEDEDLKLSCNFLENALKFEGRSDIDGEELYMELSSLDTLYTMEFSSPIEVLKHLNETQENFPNARITCRILLTVPVTVASAERSFSKLKLLKSYLRSTMSQERLNGLAMIAIESEILDSIN